MNAEIIIVSGLPRTGTSLMMQMLHRGGVDVLTDHQRSSDMDNPHGYFEYEPVKATGRDASWLAGARGKACKMVSRLLYDLPPTERYRVIFMERDMDETLQSQETMLRRLGGTAVPRGELKRAFTVHLDRLFAWLSGQPHFRVLVVSYNELMARPRQEAARVAEFLDGLPSVDRMLEAVDPALYRNRRASMRSEE